MAPFAQRLNKNIGAYFGESIDLQQVLCDDLEAARKFGWQIEKLPVSASLDLLAFYRSGARDGWRHGGCRASER